MKPLSPRQTEFLKLWWLFIFSWGAAIVAVAIQAIRFGKPTWAVILLGALAQAIATIGMARAHWKEELRKERLTWQAQAETSSEKSGAPV